MRIGPHLIDPPVVLAPMAGVTDKPFRQLCKRLGAGLAVSEMTTADPRLWTTRKSQRRMDHVGEPDPVSVQIAGYDPAMLAEAARFNVAHGAQLVDINMGCPAKKVCNVWSGSALLQDEPLVARILAAVVAAVEVPVTLKIRTGWDPAHRNGVSIARLRFGKPNGNSSIRNGLDWLLASAAGVDLAFVEVQDVGDLGIDAHMRARISQATAIDALRSLVALRRAGLQQPLPFAPYSGWELFSAEDAERGIRNAAARWRGGDRQWGEGDSDAIRLALRGRDPFADAASLREFARITGLVFGAVTRGEFAAIDINDADVPDDDAEDAA